MTTNICNSWIKSVLTHTLTSADFPTPPDPRTTSLYSRILAVSAGWEIRRHKGWETEDRKALTQAPPHASTHLKQEEICSTQTRKLEYIQNMWQQRGHMTTQLVVMSQLSNPVSVCESCSLWLIRICEGYHGERSTVSSLHFVLCMCVCCWSVSINYAV